MKLSQPVGNSPSSSFFSPANPSIMMTADKGVAGGKYGVAAAASATAPSPSPYEDSSYSSSSHFPPLPFYSASSDSASSYSSSVSSFSLREQPSFVNTDQGACLSNSMNHLPALSQVNSSLSSSPSLHPLLPSPSSLPLSQLPVDLLAHSFTFLLSLNWVVLGLSTMTFVKHHSSHGTRKQNPFDWYPV